ncbi:SNF2 family N-terminal domain-containing protein [Podospora didyma]|uniref:SNF2 family N-terminal domain-containing protein n=1 Tax=Podospora didyma TaxID=330526 RepID=A0AAE0N6F5_9PEZI|nr:SNF2 family N-terminal domain-containing protein [Podospora didyma]
MAPPSPDTNKFSGPPNPARTRELEEELAFAQGILASLEDLPKHAPETRRQLVKTKTDIISIKRSLAEARGTKPSASGNNESGNMNRLGGHDPFRGPLGNQNPRSGPVANNHARLGPLLVPSNMSAPASNWNPSAGNSFQQDTPASAAKKRSFSSTHLGVSEPAGPESKARRTMPSLGKTGHTTPFNSSPSDPFGDNPNVIDLTGDDDEWMTTYQRQKQEESRLAQMNQDAAMARRLAESPVAGATSYPQSGRPYQSTSSLGGHLGQPITPEYGLTPSAPGTLFRFPVEPESGFTSARNDSTQHSGPSGSSNAKHEPTLANQYNVPGAYVDSDGEKDDYQSMFLINPAPCQNAPSFPRSMVPGNRILPPLPGPLGAGYGRAVRLIESARQKMMNRNQYNHLEMSSTFSTQMAPMQMPHGLPMQMPTIQMSTIQMPHGLPMSASSMDRPGVMVNGAYHNLLGQTPSDSGSAAYPPLSLTSTLDRVYSREIHNYVDGVVNDPRKTNAEIQQLLSNIRPGMDIPEEDRGETPEALKYPLYDHQLIALKWMSEMEQGSNKGGILADDMGLGKTISTIALMATRGESPDRVKTNLIIGPVALIKQWENEVMVKLKDDHQLSVFLLHLKKKILFTQMKMYDVVLTTYGSVAAEWKKYHKHIEFRKDSPGYNPATDKVLAAECPLFHPRSSFHRIILDESQCIKNKDTQSSRGVHEIRATHRWCLTGTPMMNGVKELYPLFRFLQIKPYNDSKHFQNEFKTLITRGRSSATLRDNALDKLRAILKAVMLRRMKTTMLDGKPLIELPAKTEHQDHVVFSADEQSFYQDLESKSQVMFNKYLRAGTVGKNYSNILVLLLRLRQACCHPHLTDFECVGEGDAGDTKEMLALAASFDAAVVERIKAIEAFECPICYDAVANPTLLVPCGHDTCSECFTSLADMSTANNIRAGNENGKARCPVCRGDTDIAKVVKYTAFQKVHMPEKVPSDDVKVEVKYDYTDSDSESGSDSDSDPDTDSDSASEADDSDESIGSLAGFIDNVDEIFDDEEDGNELNDGGNGDDDDFDMAAELDAELNAELEVAAEKKKKKKAAKKAKAPKRAKAKTLSNGKSKVEEVKPHMLSRLRVEANKNKDARKQYLHYLRDNWEDSAKVTQVIDLLRKIQESNEKTIIFSQWTSLLDLIECKIKYTLGIKYCRYTGGMSRSHRDKAVMDFSKDPNVKVLLVSLRAGNAGLNLTCASRVIICDPFWNPYVEMQAIDRAHRIGQRREVQVHRILIKETIEDRIIELQEQKRELVDAALDSGGSNAARLSQRDLAFLFGFGRN